MIATARLGLEQRLHASKNAHYLIRKTAKKKKKKLLRSFTVISAVSCRVTLRLFVFLY